jgi:hypothetical protein
MSMATENRISQTERALATLLESVITLQQRVATLEHILASATRTPRKRGEGDAADSH